MTEKKVVKIEERIPKLKEQRKQRTNKRLILYISLFFTLMLLIVYFQTPASRVQSVEVNGNSFVTDEWVIAESGLLEDVSMWNLGADAVYERLTANDAVDNAEVSRQWLNTVIITIEEYETIAYVRQDGNYVPVLTTGRLYDGDSEDVTPYDAPILRGFESSDIREELIAELNETPSELRQRISDIILEPVENDPGRITLLMNDGFTVSSTISNFSERIAPYPSVVEQLDPDVHGIVHMRMNPYFERLSAEEEDEEEEINETEE